MFGARRHEGPRRARSAKGTKGEGAFGARGVWTNNSAGGGTGPADGNGAYNGGGILNWSTGTLEIANSSVLGNVADGLDDAAGWGGGGFVNAGDGQVEVVQSTLLANRAGEFGGAFDAVESSTTAFTNSTLPGNQAIRSGGAAIVFDEADVLRRAGRR